jgi:hypothetical protein
VEAKAAMELANTLGQDEVDGLLARFHRTSARRSKLLCLYVLARSRSRYPHAERDALLDGAGFDLLEEGVQGPRAESGVAVLTLGAYADERSSGLLVRLGQDLRDPARAADALTTLARFHSPAGVKALTDLASSQRADHARLKALETLLAAIRMSSDPSPHSPAGDAQRFLHSHGAVIARQIEGRTQLASVRRDARALQQQIASLN